MTAVTNPSEIKRLDVQLMVEYRRLDDLRWYDPARPHVFLHIRKRLSELAAAYETLQQFALEATFKGWVVDRSNEIPKFARHFDPVPGAWRVLRRSAAYASGAWGVAVVVLPVFGIAAGAATLGAAAIGLLNFFVSTWYEIEQRLFRSLDEPRSGEVQFDVIGYFLMGAVILFSYYLSTVVERHSFVRFGGAWPYVCFAWAGVMFALGVSALYSSIGRQWAWKAGL